MALANLNIYYTWKNIKSEYNNNNLENQNLENALKDTAFCHLLENLEISMVKN